MNTVLITLGLVFLMNPVIWLWDVLPDFLGAFLIMFGMRKIVLLYDETEILWRRMWRVVFISSAKVALSFLVGGAEGGVKLITSLAFTAFEIIFLLPAVVGTVGLAEKLQERFCDATAETPPSRLPSLTVFLSVYTVIRLVVGFLPECAELIASGRFGNVITGDGKYYPSDSKWMLYIVAAGLTTILFVIALIMTIKAFKRYAADRATQAAAIDAAEKVKKTDVTYWNARKWALVRNPFIVTALISTFLFIDGIDFFPKIIFATVVFALTIMHSRSVIERALAVVGSVTLGALSVISNSRLTDFFIDYNSETVIQWSDTAYADYTVITVLIIIEAALTFAMMLLMTELIKRARLSEFGDSSSAINASKKFKRQMLLMRIAMILSLGATVAYPLLRPYYPDFAFPLVITTGGLVFACSFFVDFDHARKGDGGDSVVKAANMHRNWS